MLTCWVAMIGRYSDLACWMLDAQFWDGKPALNSSENSRIQAGEIVKQCQTVRAKLIQPVGIGCRTWAGGCVVFGRCVV